jgi:hypothetical protein
LFLQCDQEGSNSNASSDNYEDQLNFAAADNDLLSAGFSDVTIPIPIPTNTNTNQYQYQYHQYQ